MKKFILLASVAATAVLALGSCEKQPTTDAQLKSVTISITNAKNTKATTTPVTNGSQVALKDFQVFFTDGTYLYTGKNADNTETDHYFTSTTGLSATVFHFINGKVNQVVVVGNLGSEVTVTDGQTTLASIKTLSNNVETLAIADQQDPTALYLYGESGLTATDRTDTEGHTIYSANVTLSPRVSRFEIGSFTYNEPTTTGATRKYSSITVQQIAFNNYFGTADKVSGAVSGNATNTSITANNVFTYLAGLLDTNGDAAGWYTDLPNAVLNADNSYKVSYPVTDGTTCPSYHFFPLGADGNLSALPQIIVYLIATPADGGDAVPLYLATSDFVITNADGTTSSAITKDFAKIYKMDFAYSDEDLENPAKCVELTVSVATWDVQTVTPTF